MDHVLQTTYGVAAPDLDGWVVLPLLFLISTFIRNILFTIPYIINRQMWCRKTHIGRPCGIVNENSRGSFAQVGLGNGHPLRLHGIQKAFQFLDSAVRKRNTPLPESSLSDSVVPGVGIKDPSRVAIRTASSSHNQIYFHFNMTRITFSRGLA
jgi:hypothetical protein